MQITVLEIKNDCFTENEIDRLLDVFLKQIACSKINGKSGLIKSHTADYDLDLTYAKRRYDSKWEGHFQNEGKKLKLVAIQEKD